MSVPYPWFDPFYVSTGGSVPYPGLDPFYFVPVVPTSSWSVYRVYGFGAVTYWFQSSSIGPVSNQFNQLIAASTSNQSLTASTTTQRTAWAEEDAEMANEALNQSVDVSNLTDQVWEFTMDPAPLEGSTYGIAGWTIEVRMARNLGDASLVTLPATIITVGDSSTASVFRVSWSTASLTGFSGIYRWQVFRTDSGFRDVLAGTRMTAEPIILS